MSEFHPVPDEFWHHPLSVRGLASSWRDVDSPERLGFVIRSIDATSEPPRFYVAAQRPGEDRVEVTSQLATHTHHPESDVEHRFYPTGEPTPEDPEVMLTQLQQHIGNHPNAGRALVLLARAAA